MSAVQNALATLLAIPVSAVRYPSEAVAISGVVSVQVLVNSEYDSAALDEILGGSTAPLTSDIVSNLDASWYTGSLSGMKVCMFGVPFTSIAKLLIFLAL